MTDLLRLRRTPIASLLLGLALHTAQAAPLELDLPAQPLAQALARLARQAGLQLLLAPDMVQDRQATALRGPRELPDALAELLRGTGLRGRTDGHTLVIERVGGDARSVLPEVKVTAAAVPENATGPVQGYTARRSASGTKTDAPILEIPQSISVIPRAQIEAQQPRSLTDALGYVPGVVALSYGSAITNAEIYLRGFSTLNGGTTYRDGTQVSSNSNYNRTSPEPYGLERIEVLRGPTSMLFGANEPGGIVNIVSKKPTTVPLHEVQLETGSFGRRQVAADFGGPLDADGEWSYRLTALQRSADTQIDFVKDRRSYLAPALTWRPSARTELTLRAEYQRNEGVSNNAWPAEGTVLANPFGRIPFNRAPALAASNNEHYTAKSLGYQFEHRADEVWTLRQNFRHSDFDGVRNVMRTEGFEDGSQRLVVIRPWARRPSATTSTLDSQVQADVRTGDIAHTVLAGVDYQRTAGKLARGNGAPSLLDVFDPVYATIAVPAASRQDLTVDNQWGLYVQDQIRIDKHLVLTVGARQDWIRQLSQVSNNGAVSSTRSRDDALTGRAGAVYVLDSGIAPYASYARSFTPTSGTDASGERFQPQTGAQYEVGVRYQPPGSDTLLSAALFDLRRRNVLTPNPQDLDFSVQRGEVRSRGLELEARTTWDKRLSLVAAYTFTDVKVTKSTDVDLGKTLAEVPRHAASLWLDVALRDQLAGMRVAAGIRYVGRTAGDYVESFRVPGFALFDLALRYDLGRVDQALRGVELSFNVANLTDKRYASCEDITSCEYGARRSFKAGVAYRW